MSVWNIVNINDYLMLVTYATGRTAYREYTRSMIDTIFDKIIDGTIPCHKVYEDEKTLAFLDINPVQPGHTLVIPKESAEFVWDLEAEDYSALMATVQKVAQKIKNSLNVPYVGEKIVGVDVPYAHVHLIPFSSVDEFNQTDLNGEPDHEALAAMAKTLAF